MIQQRLIHDFQPHNDHNHDCYYLHHHYHHVYDLCVCQWSERLPDMAADCWLHESQSAYTKPSSESILHTHRN